MREQQRNLSFPFSPRLEYKDSAYSSPIPMKGGMEVGAQTFLPGFSNTKIVAQITAQINELETILSKVSKIDSEEWLLLAKQEGGE